MMNHATRYATTPRTMAPGMIVNITQRTRTAVESTLKYSARPPHTPATFRSLVDRASRAVATALADTLEPVRTAHAATYATTPPTKPPGTIDNTIHTSRIRVTSASRYSAMPAQTPAIRPAAEFRYRRFGELIDTSSDRGSVIK